MQRDESTADVTMVAEHEVPNVLSGQDPVLPEKFDDATVSVGEPCGELRERFL